MTWTILVEDNGMKQQNLLTTGDDNTIDHDITEGTEHTQA